MKFELITTQELVDVHFGTFAQDSGTAWHLAPIVGTRVETMSEDDIMELLQEEDGGITDG